jgi:hypothetical protein
MPPERHNGPDSVQSFVPSRQQSSVQAPNYAASDFAVCDGEDADTPIAFSVPVEAWPIPYSLINRGAL